jgi:hypothetical protein
MTIYCITRYFLRVVKGGMNEEKKKDQLPSIQNKDGCLMLYYLLSEQVTHSSFPRVAYGRLNGEDFWARKKSWRLPMIPGGIYSLKSGRI